MNKYMNKPIFKEKYIMTNKYNIDFDSEIVPLYFEPVFKMFFLDKNIVKKFLTVLGFKDLDGNCYYGQDVFFNKYNSCVKKTSYLLSVDNKKPIMVTFAKTDYSNPGSTVYNIYLIFDTLFSDNHSFIRNLKRLRFLYDEGYILSKSSLMLVALTSKSMIEFYSIISLFLNKTDVLLFVRTLNRISKNAKIRKLWREYKT